MIISFRCSQKLNKDQLARQTSMDKTTNNKTELMREISIIFLNLWFIFNNNLDNYSPTL